MTEPTTTIWVTKKTREMLRDMADGRSMEDLLSNLPKYQEYTDGIQEIKDRFDALCELLSRVVEDLESRIIDLEKGQKLIGEGIASVYKDYMLEIIAHRVFLEKNYPGFCDNVRMMKDQMRKDKPEFLRKWEEESDGE